MKTQITPALNLKLFDSAEAQAFEGVKESSDGDEGAEQTGESKTTPSAAGKGKQAKNNPLSDIRYGKQDGDEEKTEQNADKESGTQAAAEKSADTLPQSKKERENGRLKKAREQSERRQRAEMIYSDWLGQSEKVKTVYPSFDLKREIQNPDFLKLLKSGVGVMDAYQVVHIDEILGGAMQYTARKIRQQTVNSIKARANRPTENGLCSQSGVVVKNDVSALTAVDRREIARRAAKGEQIKF